MVSRPPDAERAPRSRSAAALARLHRLDVWHQRHRVLAFTAAVGVRYREDRCRRYGALLSYYGFISLFPLLLVLTTVLDVVLHRTPTLLDRILDTVYARIPVVGSQLRQGAETLDTSGPAAFIGVVVTLWSGLAVVKVSAEALNLQWGVPRFQQRFFRRQLAALAALVVVGLGVVIATAATNLAAFLPDIPALGRLVGALAAIVTNIAVLTVSFRVLVSQQRWRSFLPGGIVGGIALWALQLVGGTYVTRVIVGATDVFGVFAITFGLLAWIALVARATLLANEISVVRAKRLWPRSLLGDVPTDADLRSFEELMKREALRPDLMPMTPAASRATPATHAER